MVEVAERDKPRHDTGETAHAFSIRRDLIAMASFQRRLCLPSTFTVLACGPFSPISSKNVTRVPGGTCPELLSTLFL
jgi:hypothetical protein